MNAAAAFEFKPFSLKQKKLLTWWTTKSPYRDYDMIIADGSIRSGKTVAMIDSFLMWSLYAFQDQVFIIAGKSMGALKRNVLRPMFKILAAKGIAYRYNRSENFIEIGSNTYYCFGANNEASQDVLQGLTSAGALADEAALFPESFVEQMIGRCSVEGSKIWMNCNPEGPYHYLKSDYIDKAKEKRILHLHFTLDDNLTLSQKIKDRYKRMFSGLWYKRYILGLWVLAEGVIYDMFDEDIHTGDYQSLTFDRYYVAIDYGTANPCTFGLYGVKDNVTYLLREYWYDSKDKGRQKTDTEYGDDFEAFLDGIKPAITYVDPSASSFIAELRGRGYKVVAANNDVLPGIRMVSTMIGTLRFFVDRSCKNTIKEFATYIWNAKVQQDRGEDAPVKQNDHAMDRNRYFLFTFFHRFKGFSMQV